MKLTNQNVFKCREYNEIIGDCMKAKFQGNQIYHRARAERAPRINSYVGIVNVRFMRTQTILER